MNTQTADILKHLDHLRQIGVEHIALPSTEQEKLDREWEYFETVCDQVYFILENSRYKMERQRMILLDQLNKPAIVPNEESTATVTEDMVTDSVDAPTTLKHAIEADIGNIAAQTPSVPISASTKEAPIATLQDTTTTSSSADIQMLSPSANLTPISNAAQANSVSSPLVSAMPTYPNSSASDSIQSITALPQPPTATLPAISSSVAATAPVMTTAITAAISPASILQSVGELTPSLLTVDGSMGMDSSLLTDLDNFQNSMLDLGDIGNLGDMDGMGGMSDMVDF